MRVATEVTSHRGRRGMCSWGLMARTVREDASQRGVAARLLSVETLNSLKTDNMHFHLPARILGRM